MSGPVTEAGLLLDDWLRFVRERRGMAGVPVSSSVEAIEREAVAAALGKLRLEVAGLAFEFDDATPRRFMVERREVLAAIARLEEPRSGEYTPFANDYGDDEP